MKQAVIITAALLLNVSAAYSQEAFKHLSAGLDIATTGVGLELAFPVVSDHLVLTAGYNFGSGSISAKGDTMLDIPELTSRVNKYVDDANDFLSKIPGESSRLTYMPTRVEMDGTATARLGTVKVVLEYYPAKKSGFHINAGVYFGSADILSLDARCYDLWNAYETNLATVNRVIASYPEYASRIGKIPELKATFNSRTFQIKKPGDINMSVNVAKVRPYFGLGFGRSVPNTRFGFQFDFGAMYIGKIGFASTNEVSTPAEISIESKDVQKAMDIIEKICVYPQLSFRLICRIF